MALPIRGLLSVVGSEVYYSRLTRDVKPKVLKIKPPKLPSCHKPQSAGELSVVKIWQLYGLGKLGGIWQLYGLGKMGRIWQLCGCRWLSMAVIIRRCYGSIGSPAPLLSDVVLQTRPEEEPAHPQAAYAAFRRPSYRSLRIPWNVNNLHNLPQFITFHYIVLTLEEGVY